jgi:type IV secretory pathway TraG/TraD family ATPase VirD4
MEQESEDTVKDETMRQLVVLVFSLAGTALTMLIFKAATDSTFIPRWRMRTYNKMQRYAEKQTAYWWDKALSARDAYDREKN